MVPLLRVSNISSSTTSDESDRCYVTVQLAGYIVVWLYSFGWTVLSHWPVTDEVNIFCISCVCVLYLEFLVGLDVFLYFIPG